MNKNNLLVFILFIIIYSIWSNSNASQEKVNVLTWWGYLNMPWVAKEIQDKCHTQLTFDEYFTEDEFVKLLKQRKNYYDIIIFPGGAYEKVEKEINVLASSDLYERGQKYIDVVKKQYYDKKYPHNVVYFMIIVSGFLWNPGMMDINTYDDISAIFKKTKNGIVLLADEPQDLFYFVQPFDTNEFKKLFQNSHVYITNELNANLLNRKDFSFAYQWSGIGLFYLNNYKSNYKFLIHPKYSHLSSDLLAQLNNKEQTHCVADMLSSKEFLNHMQNVAYYISPYEDGKHIDNVFIKKLYKDTFAIFNKLKWSDSINTQQFNWIHQKWDYIKLYLDLKRN